MPEDKPSHRFIYGRPVQPREFFNREQFLERVYGRIRNVESAAVVGEPHIGKSSLLLMLADPDTQAAYLGSDRERFTITLLDLHPVSSDYTPAQFWSDALDDLALESLDQRTSQYLQLVRDRHYDRRALERLFTQLGRNNCQLVLLLDEFEQLLRHPHFKGSNFFPLLRSLSTRTGGLAIILASRLSVDEMNKLCHPETGSPYFNNLIDLKLLPFDEAAVQGLLAQAGDDLLPGDATVIEQVAGRHPFLTQAMAAALVEEPPGPTRYACAFRRFYEEVSFHFEDLWRYLDDRTRAAAVIVSLLGIGNKALGDDFSQAQLGSLEPLGEELRRLARVGLAQPLSLDEPSDWHYPVFWQNERWTIGARAFAWWVREVVVSGMRVIPSFEDWLDQGHYRALLTGEQWRWLINTIRSSDEFTDERSLSSDENFSRLRLTLSSSFDENELQTLCFDLGIDYQELTGQRKTDKVCALIAYCARRNRVEELRQAILRARTHLSPVDV